MHRWIRKMNTISIKFDFIEWYSFYNYIKRFVLRECRHLLFITILSILLDDGMVFGNLRGASQASRELGQAAPICSSTFNRAFRFWTYLSMWFMCGDDCWRMRWLNFVLVLAHYWHKRREAFLHKFNSIH